MEAGVSGRQWGADGIVRGIRRTFQSPGDVTLAARMGLFLAVMPRRLEARPLNQLLSDITKARSGTGGITRQVERISRLRQAWLASPLFRERNTCYVRAITLFRFLDDGGGRLRIHFGVEPGVSAGDRLRGHAWVTLDAEVLEAPEPVVAGRVSELYSYP